MLINARVGMVVWWNLYVVLVLWFSVIAAGSEGAKENRQCC